MIIDGNDIMDYGAFVLEGGYDDFLAYPEMGKVEFNDWPEEDGIEVELSDPKLRAREITVPFLIKGDSSFNAFMDMLAKPGYRSIEIPDLGKTYSLRMLSEPYHQDYGSYGKQFNIKFAEDTIIRPTITQPSGSGCSLPHSSFKIDDVSLNDYGITDLLGGSDSIKRMSDIKKNLTRSMLGMDGIIYDTAALYMKSRDFNIDCLFMCQNMAEFWSCHDSFLCALIQPHERLLYAEATGKSYPCYYKKTSNWEIHVLRSYKVVVEFRLTLTITSFP